MVKHYRYKDGEIAINTKRVECVIKLEGASVARFASGKEIPLTEDQAEDLILSMRKEP